nr:PaaI family thioesterase [Ardenticatena sp.]
MREEVLTFIQQVNVETITPEEWLAAMNKTREFTAIGPLGATFEEVSDEHIVMEMPITDNARQPVGLLHGGVSLLLAETAASAHAFWRADVRERVPVGIEINGSHLRSASDGRVRVVGRVLRRSRSFIVHEVEIWHVEREVLLSVCRVTNYYKPVAQ